MTSHPLLSGEIKLREYQESAVAVAMATDTLVVLPTGLGKTVIALFVAAHRLHKFPKSKILFLAPTKPLAQQHMGSFKKHLKLEDPKTGFALLTGEEAVEKRKAAFAKARAIFATPQTIENDIITGNIDLKDVSLIVFDEAHRAVGEYAYVFIAKKYAEQGRDKLSLALTASPGHTKEKIKEIVDNLGIKDVEIKTDRDRDVRPYVEKMDFEWVKVEFPENFKRLRGLLAGAMKEYIGFLKKRGCLEGKNIDNLSKKDILELQAGLRQQMLEGNMVWDEVSDVAALLKLQHGLELLETQGIAQLDEYFKRMKSQKSKAVATLLKRDEISSAIGLAQILHSQGVDHPKLEKLRSMVREQLAKKRLSKIIVFTNYRDSVDRILSMLEGEKDVVAKKLIGQATKGKQKGMSQKEQKEILMEFNNSIFNVLVASSIGEEGLDIEEVDLVAFYEPIPSEIRTIQRRGRTARKKPGRLAILMTVGTRDEVYYWAAFHKERRMRAAMKQVKREFAEARKDEIGHGSGKRGDMPGQSSLKSFFGESKEESKTKQEEKVHVYVDQRERNSGIAKKLSEMGAGVEIKQLEVADFVVSEKVCIERKTNADFLQSLIDGRLMDQMSNMCRNFETPIVMIEGDPGALYAERNIHPNAIRGAIASIAVNFGIPIIYTTGPEDTAAYVYTLAKREQEGKTKEIALRGEKRAMSTNEWQRFVVESLPNVSAITAKKLLRHFGSVEKVFRAPEEKLQEVDGVGEVKAKRIREIIEAEYKEE